jgi:hypothetical protein
MSGFYLLTANKDWLRVVVDVAQPIWLNTTKVCAECFALGPLWVRLAILLMSE